MRQIIIAQIEQLVANTRVGDLLDILVIALILYLLLNWFRQRASRAVLVGGGLIAILYTLTRVLNMFMTSMLFHAGLAATLVFLVIIFQQDIRRSFELLAGWRLFDGSKRHPVGEPEFIDTLVSTVTEMAENRVGALIILQGREAIDRHVRGGVRANAEISYPLLLSIFDPHSPGHDGAAVVDQGRIDRIGVLLPLSNNLREVGIHGTRHTAALGLAEQCDALAIVVSEERGTISIAHRERLKRVDSTATLKQRIEEFYRSTYPEPATRPGWRWIREHFGLKIVSLALSCLLWFVLAYRVETVYRTIEVPIEYRNLPASLIIKDQLPSHARLTLSGPERSFTMNTSIPPVSVDMAGLKEGEHELAVDGSQVTIPPGLDLIRVEPGLIQFDAARKAVVELPIRVRVQGEKPQELEIVTIPDSVAVQMDASAWGKVLAIPTEPLALDSVTRSTSRDVRLLPPEGTALQDTGDTTVRVKIHVRDKNR